MKPNGRGASVMIGLSATVIRLLEFEGLAVETEVLALSHTIGCGIPHGVHHARRPAGKHAVQ